MRWSWCLSAAALLAACGTTRDMPSRVEMRDTLLVHRAMQDRAARDSMLDTMPGGEMARGDSAAEMRLLQKKR